MVTAADYWALEGFDRETEELIDDRALVGLTDDEWGELFGIPRDGLGGECEVSAEHAAVIEHVLGVRLDLERLIYFAGRRRDP